MGGGISRFLVIRLLHFYLKLSVEGGQGETGVLGCVMTGLTSGLEVFSVPFPDVSRVFPKY